MDKEIRFESNIETNNTNLMGKCEIIRKLLIQTALCLVHTDFAVPKNINIKSIPYI